MTNPNIFVFFVFLSYPISGRVELVRVYSTTKMLVRNTQTIRQRVKSVRFLPLMAHMTVRDVK